MPMVHSAGDKDQTPGLAAVGARKRWWFLRGMRREAGDGDQDGDKDGTEGAVRVVRCFLPAAQRIACIAFRHHTPYPCLDLDGAIGLCATLSTSEFRSR